MESTKICGPNPALLLSYKDLPIGATQIAFDPNLNKTGTWRFVRPVVSSTMPPCRDACPAGVDIRTFIRLIKDGLAEQAFEDYMEENPFPSICGRVCFHPCETACNRGYFDSAVAINGLENYIGSIVNKKLSGLKENGKKVAIIGSGPAGLSCAYFLRRLGYEVAIFEKESESGGILRYGIPEYRLPKKVLGKEIQKLHSWGIDTQTGKELGRNLSFSELKSYDAVFIATGAHVSVSADISGTEADGVYTGLNLLKKVATGDIKSFAKKTVVIGGGNTAIDTARTILRLGGKPTIYYRRSRDEMPATKSEITDCEKEGIELHYLTSPVKVLSKLNKVTGIEFVRNKLGNPDESQRRISIPVEGSNFKVDAEAVILATGEATDLTPFKGILKTERNLIKVNEFSQASDKKIFAGGDVTHYQRTVTYAIGSGKRAAIGIDCYLKGTDEKETMRILGTIATNQQGALSFKKYLQKDFSITETAGQVIRYEELNPAYFEPQKRNERPESPVEGRIKSFQEVRRRFMPKTAHREAERCFSCGLCNSCGTCFIFCPDSSICLDENQPAAQINYDYCKGCGICTEECPKGVIRMVQEE